MSNSLKNFLTLFLFASAAAGPLVADEALPPGVSKTLPALVKLDVVLETPQGGRLMKQAGTGSGVIIDAEGHVVTNHHVAGRAIKVKARLHSGEEIAAELIGTDPLTDVAVVKLDLASRADDAPPIEAAEFGDSDAVRVGHVVYAMGSPAAVTQSVTRGIVANTQMILPERYWFAKLKLEGEDVGRLVKWIGHDAVIFGGNSGGPLVNEDGKIIGINEVGLGSLGGAIPGNLARQIAAELIENGWVNRSWLGLELQAVPANEAKGALVSTVYPGGPAASAEFQAGDILTEINGEKIAASSPEELVDVNQIVVSLPVGEAIEATVLRGDMTVKLSVNPLALQDARGKDREVKSWGMVARDFTNRYALEKGREDAVGVFLQSTRPGRFAADGDPPLQTGDVILSIDGQHLSNTEALETISDGLLADLDPGAKRKVLVGFERNGQQMVSVVEIGSDRPDEPRRSVRKAWIPIETQVLTRELAEGLGIESAGGVRVTQVYANPEEGDQQLLKVGDIIKEIDGAAINATRNRDGGVFSAMVKSRPVDAPLKLTVLRGENAENIEVELTPELEPLPTEELPSYADEILEFEARDLDRRELAGRSKAAAEPVGVKVVVVESSGWAALGKLALEDLILKVDGEPIENTATLREILKQAREDQAETLQFFVRRNAVTHFLKIEPLWESN